MTKLLLPSLTVFLLGVISNMPAQAGPDRDRQRITTVAWIKEQDRKDNIDADDRYVVLVGRVVRQDDDDAYQFSDGTGTIQLDSDKRLPIGVPIVIRGRVDQAFMGIGRLEVDVQSWRHVAKSR